MWEVNVALISEWLSELDSRSLTQVVAAIELLAENGPQLGRPLVDTVTTSKHRHMKELRPGSSGRSELRILFAFDPQRHAIMLIAGDKSNNWKAWYKSHIPIADEFFDNHLQKLQKDPES